MYILTLVRKCFKIRKRSAQNINTQILKKEFNILFIFISITCTFLKPEYHY